IYASRASLRSLQDALAALYHTRWQRFGEGDAARYQLLDNTALDAQAERLRQTRRSQFLSRLLQTGLDLRRRDPRAAADRLRADVAARFPDLQKESLDR